MYIYAKKNVHVHKLKKRTLEVIPIDKTPQKRKKKHSIKMMLKSGGRGCLYYFPVLIRDRLITISVTSHSNE